MGYKKEEEKNVHQLIKVHQLSGKKTRFLGLFRRHGDRVCCSVYLVTRRVQF